MSAEQVQPDPSSGAAAEVSRTVSRANAWREQYNPLRSISMVNAISWLEQAQRGEYADVQWAYSFIERRDPDLLSIIERRTGAIVQMDWDIKTVERRFKVRGLPFDQALATEQQAMLRGAYDQFSNLYEAIEHLSLATFRGFSHVQYLADSQLLKTLGCLDQWNILRNGPNGDWYWNAAAQNRSAKNANAEERLNPAAYVIRVNKRPVNEIALVKFLRQNLSAKDWDGFLEIYGIPGWIVVMAPSIPAGKESEYEATAKAIAEGGSGALPNGSDAKCADQPRGVVPFEQHLRYWSEKLVMAGTGGLLTMLTAPGSGTLAGSAHQEAFDLLARAEARKISELFQRSIDRYLLQWHFPNRPALAYFDLASNEEQDVGEILTHAEAITRAGGQVDWTQIAEKTGYKIIAAPPPVVQPGFPPAFPLRNRAEAPAPAAAADSVEPLVEAAVEETLSVRSAILQDWLQRIADLAEDPNIPEQAFLDTFEQIIRSMPAELLTPENVKALAAPLEASLGSAVVNALVMKETAK